jgi:hypothetical protein
VIFTSDPRERLRHRPASDRNGGRLRLGTTAGFKSESPAGFVGIRRQISATVRDEAVVVRFRASLALTVERVRDGQLLAEKAAA